MAAFGSTSVPDIKLLSRFPILVSPLWRCQSVQPARGLTLNVYENGAIRMQETV